MVGKIMLKCKKIFDTFCNIRYKRFQKRQCITYYSCTNNLRRRKYRLAYKYIKFAFEDAVYYNSRLRFIQIAQIFSSITESYQIKAAKQKTHLKTLVFAISILLAGPLALVLIYGQMRKLRITRNDLRELNLQMKNANIEMKSKNNELRWLNGELSQSNLTKELYISNFMTICSDFIDKLDKYRLKTRNLVLSKEYNTLIKMTKNSELIEEEIREFYVTFDNTF